ncbi:MAG: hypothetical protein WCP85_07890 [Mariniphaga sp.]
MELEIITSGLQFEIYGFGGIATNKDYAGTAFKLSGRMWEVVKANRLKNKGMNIWVYEADDKVFTGVELDDPSDTKPFGLEKMTVDFEKYAYYKYFGPYGLIKHAGRNMKNELSKLGYEVKLPYLEIYGHWTSDESKLETELFMCLK